MRTRQSPWVATLSQLKQWQAAWRKMRVEKKTAEKICALRLAMKTPLFQLRCRFNSGTLPGSLSPRQFLVQRQWVVIFVFEIEVSVKNIYSRDSKKFLSKEQKNRWLRHRIIRIMDNAIALSQRIAFTHKLINDWFRMALTGRKVLPTAGSVFSRTVDQSLRETSSD